jgi:hypothetical protein
MIAQISQTDIQIPQTENAIDSNAQIPQSEHTIDPNKPVGFRDIPAGNLDPGDRIRHNNKLYRYCSWEPGYLRCRTLDTNRPCRLPHRQGARVEVGVYSARQVTRPL